MVTSVAVLSDIHGVLPVLADVVAASGFPGRQAWADEYVRSRTSDADAIRAFTPAGDRPG